MALINGVGITPICDFVAQIYRSRRGIIKRGGCNAVARASSVFHKYRTRPEGEYWVAFGSRAAQLDATSSEIKHHQRALSRNNYVTPDVASARFSN